MDTLNEKMIMTGSNVVKWEVEIIRQTGCTKKSWWNCVKKRHGKFRHVPKGCAVQE